MPANRYALPFLEERLNSPHLLIEEGFFTLGKPKTKQTPQMRLSLPRSARDFRGIRKGVYDEIKN